MGEAVGPSGFFPYFPHPFLAFEVAKLSRLYLVPYCVGGPGRRAVGATASTPFYESSIPVPPGSAYTVGSDLKRHNVTCPLWSLRMSLRL